LQQVWKHLFINSQKIKDEAFALSSQKMFVDEKMLFRVNCNQYSL